MTVAAPRGLARFNKVVTNRIQGLYAPWIAPWAVIRHRGRRSGREYSTPVFAWKSGNRLGVAVAYGAQSDWLLNALAADSARVTRAGRTYTWSGLHVVPAAESGMSAVARGYTKPFGSMVVGDLTRD
ncbi:MAG TPA: nitroreductase family deazaflavin-dependent oxidoreductase [Nocardioidaceae bacterium]|nr:nitroreductase family deazaflavin-dependent oxidoreductase [Nocardioidaceae bacterium]